MVIKRGRAGDSAARSRSGSPRHMWRTGSVDASWGWASVHQLIAGRNRLPGAGSRRLSNVRTKLVGSPWKPKRLHGDDRCCCGDICKLIGGCGGRRAGRGDHRHVGYAGARRAKGGDGGGIDHNYIGPRRRADVDCCRAGESGLRRSLPWVPPAAGLATSGLTPVTTGRRPQRRCTWTSIGGRGVAEVACQAPARSRPRRAAGPQGYWP